MLTTTYIFMHFSLFPLVAILSLGGKKSNHITYNALYSTFSSYIEKFPILLK